VQVYQRLIEAFPQSPQLQSYQTYLAELQKKMQLEKKTKKIR
jgi:hypothetical protein